MTDSRSNYTHEQWNKAVQNGNGFVRMGGNPGMQFININKLTPEQIERANNIEQNGYFIPPKNVPDDRIHRDATRGYNGLQKFFGKILGDQQWMDQNYPTGGAAPLQVTPEEFTDNMSQRQYQDPRQNYDGMQYQVPGPQGDFTYQNNDLAFNPWFEDVRTRIFKETPDQQKQRLNQKVVDYLRFKMKNPNFLFNDYIDDEIRDINRYKRDRLIT